MPARYYLGLDNGGTMTKAGLLDIKEKRFVAIDLAKTEMLYPAPDRTEKDFEQIWQANIKVIKGVLSSSQVNPKEIGGIAVTGHGNGLYLADAQGRQVHNGIVSTDTRADSYAERCRRDGSFDRLLPLTMSSIWGAQPPMLLQWFKDNDPKSLEKAKYIFTIKDLIRFRLTGEAYSERTDMSGAHLLNNTGKGHFDDAIFEAFGILDLKDKIPPLKESHDCCGRITKEVAEASGLAEGTPVYGGIFDITSCAIASGVVDSSKISLIGGTWSINQYISRTPVIEPSLFMDSLYCIPGWHLVTEASPTGASNLEWFVSNILVDERLACAEAGKSIFTYCEEMISTSTLATAPLFVPFLFGSHSSGVASGCFMGLKSFHKKADLIRAVYEGVVFSHKYHVERLKGFGATADVIRLSGGAAKSKMWMQMFADAIAMPIETTACEELGILGTLMSALVGSGAYRDYAEAAADFAEVNNRIDPDAALSAAYEERFERYRRIIESACASL